MKRLIALVTSLILVLWVSVIYAAPVGNIATPAVLKKGLVMQEESDYYIVMGPELDFTFDHNFENQNDDTESNFFGAKAGIAYADKLVVYGIIGAGGAEQEFTISGTKVKWDTEYGLVWGLGATFIAYETTLKEMGNGILRIGLDGRYRQSDLDVDKVTVGGTSYTLPHSSVSSTKYELGEWQVALAVSYQIDKVIPYLGVKYSDATNDATTTVSGTTYKVDFAQDDNVGLFVGGDILAGESISLNVEGRFIDETAFTGAATIRF